MKGKEVGEGLRLSALFRLRSQVSVTAFPASGGLRRVARVALHADFLVKKPLIGLLETCHVIPLR